MREICVTVALAAVSLGMQGCSLSNMCNHNIPGTCSAATVGAGGCESLKGASHKKATSVGECRGMCKDTKDCVYYAYCSDADDCPVLFKETCGLVANEDCKLATSLSRDKLTTFKMYDASIHEPLSREVHFGASVTLGLVTVGGIAMVWLRLGRSARQNRDMELLEETSRLEESGLGE